MNAIVPHAMQVQFERDELARQAFISEMRGHLFRNVAPWLHPEYELKAAPAFEHEHGNKPENSSDVHKSMRGEKLFRFYSALRVNTQKLIYRSVLPGVERDADNLVRQYRTLHQSTKKAKGTLTLDTALQVPNYVADIDVHLMPGCYHSEYQKEDVSAGAVYDNGSAVLFRSTLGETDLISACVAKFTSAKNPEFKPQKILDIGCTVGINTLPWATTYPDAEIHALDVAAPCLRYGHARAQALGKTVHFHQGYGNETGLSDQSFDMIYSCMVLHELPPDVTRGVYREAHRLLKPGGLMLHYELPPAKMLNAYENFMVDWDTWYNKEPYFMSFRAMDPEEECVAAGFNRNNFVQYIILHPDYFGEERMMSEIHQKPEDAERLLHDNAEGVRWYCFGAWK